MRYRLIFFLIGLLLFSCIKIDCEENAKLARERECLIVVEKFLPYQEYSLNVKGKNIIDGKDCNCVDKGRWWNQYREYIEPGDTIIKRKGELTFSIHKSDTIISYQWICEGKEYF